MDSGDRRQAKLRSMSGASMIEYVTLVSSVILAMTTAAVFIPSQHSFGFLGNAFVVWCQKVQAVLSLPFP